MKKTAAELEAARKPETPPVGNLPESDSYTDKGIFTYYSDYGKLIGWARIDGDFIIGEIENRLGRSVSMLSVQFDLLDNGAKIRETSAYIGHLAAGEKWKFKCYTWREKYTSYRFGQIRRVLD